MTKTQKILNQVLLALILTGLLSGTIAWFINRKDLANLAWGAATAISLVPILYSFVRQMLRKEFGVDIIALIAMGAALALGQYLPGAIVGLMLTGGQALEAFADSRARRELTALLQRAPRVVHRYEGEKLTSPDINDVRPGDLLLVKPGEVVPVDGVVVKEIATLDESALTGEARLVDRHAGEQALSGVVNAGGKSFDLRAIATADKSTYAGIVRLVQEAQESKAPFARLADRYALLFVPVTLLLSGLAWFFSGDPVRALAVLVVATPCPLILATPVALVSGISRAASRGIIIKGGGALEALAGAEILLLDKTGTLTTGMSVVSDIESFGKFEANELLHLAASLDQVSPHVLAAAIVRAARERGVAIHFPTEVTEEAGTGIRGKVGKHRVALGKSDWLSQEALPPRARELRKRSSLEGMTNVFIAIDGTLAGAIVLDDPIRTEAPRTIRALRRLGIKRVVTVTGDHPDLAEIIGAAIGSDEVLAERTPAEKVEAVKAENLRGKTIMVGDGINDAPALAVADVGIAMGVRGATASSEAADVVLMVDRLDRLVDALRIARRSHRIAVESIVFGMGLSITGMFFAAFGYLTPVLGAFLQEGIDVIVILNALRALRDKGSGKHLTDSHAVDKTEKLRHEHQHFMPEIKHMRQVADRLDSMPPLQAKEELIKVKHFLIDELLPHELEEDASVYPLVAKLMGGDDPTATMSRAHLEISHLTRLLVQLVEGLPPEGPSTEDYRDLRRILYGLNALLTLHFAQEDEHYLSLLDEHLALKDHSLEKIA